MMLTLNEAWNKRELPALNDLIRVAVNQRIIDCLERGVQVFSSALETLRDASALRTELFVVSRYLHRRKAQIRRHKTRQVLSQVQSCLRRLEELNLNALMTRTHKQFLQARRSQQSGGVVYLPSRGVLEQMLVRLMGGAALLVQTVNYCVNATLVLQADVKLAHLLPSTMMCLAAVSRIWACSRSLYLDYISWYGSLLPELKVLPKGQVWLSEEEEEFPRDLTLWLNSRLDMEHISSSPVSIDEAMKCVPPQVTLSAEGSSQPSQDDSDQDLAVPQQRTGEDIGAPVMISREDLGIKHSTAATRPKKNKRLEDVTIETESSSDEEPSSNAYRKFQKQAKRYDFDDSDPSAPSPPREKPRFMGLKRRHEEGSKTTTKKWRQHASEGSSPASQDDSDLAIPHQRTDIDIGAPVTISREDLGIKHNTAATRPKTKKKKCLEDVTIETESSSDEEPSSNAYRKFQKQAKRYDSDDSSDPSSPSPPREKPRLKGLKRGHEEGSKPSSTATTTKKLRQGAPTEDITSKTTGLKKKDLKESQSVISKRSKVLEQSVVNVKTQEQVSVKQSQTSSTSDVSSSNACDATVSNSNIRSKNLPESVNVRTQKSKSVKHGERSIANGMSSLSRNAFPVECAVSSSNKRSNYLPESEVEVETQESRSVNYGERSSANSRAISSTNADVMTVTSSNERSTNLQRSEVNVQTLESTSLKRLETSPASGISSSSKNACDVSVTVSNSIKRSNNLLEPVVKVETQDSTSVNHGARSLANSMSSPSRNAHANEMAVNRSDKRSKTLPGPKVQESMSVKRIEASSASDMSNLLDNERGITSTVESHKHPGHGTSASTSRDSEDRNIDRSSDNQNSSESDEENQESPNVPDQPSTENLLQTNSQLKRLKRDINDCVDVQGVVDVFFRLKPEGTSTSSPWDPWPGINLQKKTELFNKKFESIENCVRKTPKRKVLPKLKVHCFRFMKEVQELTKRGITEMMTRDAMTRYVGELGESKLTWLGKTVILPARKAKIVKLDLESLLRKMLKATNNIKRLVLLQTKAGRIITRAVQSV